MDLVTPGLGLLVWATVVFLILLFILGKFAWGPILKALNDREKKITDSLELAEKTRLEMENIKAGNEKMLKEASIERDKILKEAKEMRDSIVATAKKSADEEGRRMIAQAKDSIEKEKSAAMAELKNLSATIGVEIAEKILRKKLESNTEQDALIADYINHLNLN
ncbi:MAG: F0F1 ATP synthase subunit B [Bacteroidota bacterium]|nr:F0F1 ATP synthase subunit B [Bacteroidota bacterium]